MALTSVIPSFSLNDPIEKGIRTVQWIMGKAPRSSLAMDDDYPEIKRET